MKKSKSIKSVIVSLIVLLFSVTLFSQTITVDGYAFLEGQTEHSGIKVLFMPSSPSAQLDSIYTNQDGSFNISIEPGVYYLSYSKPDYQTFFYEDGDAVVFGQSETLDDVILVPGNLVFLSGYVSGILTSDNTYIIESDITIANGSALTIEPGTVIKFGLDCNMNINGSLYAVGTENENILFTSVENNPQIQDWDKIFYNGSLNDSLILRYCTIKYGNMIKIEGGNTIIENCDISYMEDPISGWQSNYMIVQNNHIHYFDHIGISTGQSNIIIRNNSIVLNKLDTYGSWGITCGTGYDNELIESNIIYSPDGNYTSARYGIWCDYGGNCEISNNVFNNLNTAIILRPEYPIKVINNIFVNIFEIGVTIYDAQATTLLQSNIFTGNNLGIETELDNGFIEASFNNLWGNIEDFNSDIVGIGQIVTTNSNGDPCDTYYNISLDPLFVDYNNFDFHIADGSPVIDAGNNINVVSELDLDNNYRIWDGNNDGTAIVDMGVYEFGSIPTVLTSTFNCPNNICVFDTAFIEYTGSASDTANYNWNFDDGTIISGSGQGPYEVSWTESGEELVSLFVEENGFSSETTTQFVNVIPLPTVFAGEDVIIFTGDYYSVDDAIAGNFESLFWESSGDGNFNDYLSLNPIYYPGDSDIQLGAVTLSLSNLSFCGEISDELVLTIGNITVDAGIDVEICEGNSTNLNAIANGNHFPFTYLWSPETGLSDPTSPNPLASPNETTLYFVTVTDTLNFSVTDSVLVTVIPLPTVYAGQDDTIYAGEPITILDADAENYESVIWLTSGDGTFDNASILHPVYTPGQNDISNGFVLLTLSANSSCGIIEDEILLSIEHLSLSGSVYAGNNLLDSGVVLIFDIDESYYLPVQYTFVDNGNYNFEGLSLGNYIVYAIPNPYQITGYFPTYYVNQLFWWDAYEIDLFGNAYDVDIHLVEIPDKDSGNGNISGVITYESPEVYEEEIYGNDWFGNTTGSPFGAWNIPVFLIDEGGNAIGWALSNESGIFEFTGLPYGQYTLTMEKAGFQYSSIPEVVLDENNPIVNDVEIVIESGDISVDVPNNNIVENEGIVVYPNPVSDKLNIELDKTREKIKLELFTLAGHKVLSKQIGNFLKEFQIDVSFLGKGVYIGIINVDNKKYYFKILK